MIRLNLRRGPRRSPRRAIAGPVWVCVIVLLAALSARAAIGREVRRIQAETERLQSELVETGRRAGQVVTLAKQRGELEALVAQRRAASEVLRAEACLLRRLQALVPVGVVLREVRWLDDRLVLLGSVATDEPLVDLVHGLSVVPWVAAPPRVDVDRKGAGAPAEFTIEAQLS